ncbi:nime/cyclinb [Mycena olivaceomarginata]|nr:nime/cyclinb [Mycena olivaceomarginata]
MYVGNLKPNLSQGGLLAKLAAALAESSTGSADAAASAGKPEASAKRKRKALRELPTLRDGAGGHKTLGLPKESTKAASRPPRTVKDENQRPPLFVAPSTSNVSYAAHPFRSSSLGRPLNSVLQREEDHSDDDDRPISKRQRMLSLGAEDVTVHLDCAAEDTHSDEAEPRANRDGDLWEDLDAPDFDDPTMVSEYVTDIYRYFMIVERNTMPNPNYMDNQPKLTWEMRTVHMRFRLMPETLFLCTNLIDRFLSTRTILPSKLQLVGMACLLVASKFEESISPAIDNFIFICNGTYTSREILQAEQHVLRDLHWDLSYPSPVNYLRRISKADGYDPRTRTLAKYLAEIVCVEHRLLPSPPSLLAAAAMWLARIALGEEEWSHTLAHYAMYTESVLIPVATHMLYYVLQPIRHQSLYKKYAGKRNMKASVYMRQWALTRWAEDITLDLAADLPDLKNEILHTSLVEIGGYLT